MAGSKRTLVHIGRGSTLRLRGECWYLDYNFKGQRSRRSLYTSDRGTAEVVARDLIAEAQGRDWGIPIPRDVSFDDFIRDYEEYSTLHHSSNTQELSRPTLERFKGFLIERRALKRPLLLSDITREDIESFQATEAARTRVVGPERKRIKTRHATVNIYVRVIAAFLGFAVQRQLLRKNPASGVKRLSEQVDRQRTLNPSQIAALLTEATKDIPLLGPGRKGKGTFRGRVTPMYEIIRLILNTGARLGEALFLEWADIDWDRRILFVPFGEEYQPKDREKRPIGMNDAVFCDLRKLYLRRDPKLRWVFANLNGKPFGNRNALRELKRIAEKVGLGWCNFKVLRRTFASESARTMPPFVLQQIMGHSSVRTTEKHYVHLRGMGEWIPPVIGA